MQIKGRKWQDYNKCRIFVLNQLSIGIKFYAEEFLKINS